MKPCPLEAIGAQDFLEEQTGVILYFSVRHFSAWSVSAPKRRSKAQLV